MQFEDDALKSNVLALASRSKAKAKPHRRISASSSTNIVPQWGKNLDRYWPKDYSPIAYPVFERLSTLHCHGHLLRENDGAIEFWRFKEYLGNDLVQSQHWTNEKWKSSMAKGGGKQENISDPSLQDKVVSFNDFFWLRMCHQFTLFHEFRIDIKRTKFEQQTDNILFVCGFYGQRR